MDNKENPKKFKSRYSIGAKIVAITMVAVIIFLVLIMGIDIFR